MTPIPAPDIDYVALAPVIIVLAGAIISVLLEAFLPEWARRSSQLLLTGSTLGLAFLTVIVVAAATPYGPIAGAALVIDGPGLFLQGLILFGSAMAALIMADRRVDPGGDAFAGRVSTLPGGEEEREVSRRGLLQTEVWPLLLFCVAGMLLFVTSNDFLTLFVALEILSLPLYLLVGMARRRRLLSQEAALKYFLMGALASAILLFGSALAYAFSGTITFAGISQTLAERTTANTLILAAVALVLVGLLFKIGAVPFGQWVPDVYQGAPTPVTGFMAGVVKVAAAGALLRVLYVPFSGMRWEWEPILWVVSILTMLIGSVIALAQTDIKRMLAYSSIANAGFILIGVAAADQIGLGAVLFYLLAYSVATIAAFGMVTMVRLPTGEATGIDQWAGIGRRSPVLATAFSLILLSFAGIPLTAGFIAKFSVFRAAIGADALPLVFAGIIASAIAAALYIRIIVRMYFTDPVGGSAGVATASPLTVAGVGLGVALTVILGVFPQPVLNLIEAVSIFAR